MAKRVEKDGKFYRLRRGRLVEIPPEWVGQTAHPQSVRKRRSKASHGEREVQSHPAPSGFFTQRYRAFKRAGATE